MTPTKFEQTPAGQDRRWSPAGLRAAIVAAAAEGAPYRRLPARPAQRCARIIRARLRALLRGPPRARAAPAPRPPADTPPTKAQPRERLLSHRKLREHVLRLP